MRANRFVLYESDYDSYLTNQKSLIRFFFVKPINCVFKICNESSKCGNISWAIFENVPFSLVWYLGSKQINRKVYCANLEPLVETQINRAISTCLVIVLEPGRIMIRVPEGLRSPFRRQITHAWITSNKLYVRDRLCTSGTKRSGISLCFAPARMSPFYIPLPLEPLEGTFE